MYTYKAVCYCKKENKIQQFSEQLLKRSYMDKNTPPLASFALNL